MLSTAADLRNNRSSIVFQAAVRYTGALDYLYVRIVGSRYNFGTNGFQEIGAAYNYEVTEKNIKSTPAPVKIVP